jgi:4-hydroxythreonine-4-phosphate dehydrogenase
MKPRIAITIGDPAGIGPEIVSDAVRDPKVLAVCDPLVVGDPVAFERIGEPLPKVEMVSSPGLPKDYPLAEPSKVAGISAVEALRLAVELVQSRQAQALVTAPVSKESLHLAEAGVPGHTEWLAKATNAPSVGMLMVAGKLRALLLTRHVALSGVSRHLTRKQFESGAELANQFVKNVLGRKKPKIVACGLNPHAGDGGLLGKEEARVMAPAIRALAKRGIPIIGPRSADAVFAEMARGEYDLALAAYHDQGMIPLKLHSAHQLVNITLGLPFIRTSPGHGTAYDIAGKDRADSRSLKEAIYLAARYSAASL